MGKNHENFYENLEEAVNRLQGTVVLYDGLPYYLVKISDHMKDKVFRVYMKRFDQLAGARGGGADWPRQYYDNPYDPALPGKQIPPEVFMDKWLETPEGKKSGWLRKQINSPLFNKFRPFPLGFVNLTYGKAVFTERGPTRARPQGMTHNSVVGGHITLIETNTAEPRYDQAVSAGNFWGTKEFDETIRGIYPNYRGCIDKLESSMEVESVAFDRNFALQRGPLDMIFLAYKTKIVGIANKPSITLGKKFSHLKELCLDLGVVSEIVIRP